MFVGHNFIVTFHESPSSEIGMVRKRVMEDKNTINKGVMYIFYSVMDEIVYEYFPSIYKSEDELNEIETKKKNQDLIENYVKHPYAKKLLVLLCL
ncbi:CorA family divalent cation transporter [Peribacillus frigoritolerans]|uniref:CorA family divalent cation transporter n=1 Tax=Peribacillus frigoritolerans TaxID=450367 RepID=UPI00345C654E